jgi:hypothetical protein
MLRLAPDPSDKPRLLDEVYPGRTFEVVAWDKCCECDRDVDAYIYVASMPCAAARTVRRGYCNNHYVSKMTRAYAE